MLRHAVPLLVLTAGALTGCGADGDVRQVRGWVQDVPVLALPEVGRGAPTTEPRRATTDETPDGAASAPRDDTRAPTDEEVEAELREAFGDDGDVTDRAALTQQGLATAPPSAPPVVQRIIAAANQVARKPYVYGGGHGGGPEGVFVDTAYDCSGSMSFALAAAGLIESPMVSGTFAKWGKPGPGKWVTIYANGGHAFMVIAGLRFDTSGRQRTGTRWQTAPRSVSGFDVRHPAGL